MQSFNLDRFIKAQVLDFNRANAEILEGKKRNDWMSYIFPQIKGTSDSFESKIYEISGLREALLFYNHSILGDRYLRICDALNNSEQPLQNIFNDQDIDKLHASLTLFHIVDGDQTIFPQLIQKHFDGMLHEATISQLEKIQHF